MLYLSDFHDYQNTAYAHALEHPMSMLFMDMGLGKLNPVTEPVLTPAGWREIGALRPGDEVIGRDGRPTAVIAVFPQVLCRSTE